MTIGGMTCSSPQDLSTLSTCLWQVLGAEEDRHDQSVTGGSKLQGPRSRHRHSACCVGEYVYVFGGKEGTSPRKDVWRFHIGSCKWEAVELPGSGLPFLQGHTSVAHKNLVLIFGGTFSDSVGDAQLWTFDTDTGHVEEKKLKAGFTQPSCRRDHSAVVHNSTMYVYGGFVGSRGANQQMWALDIDDMKWMELRALSQSQPGGRYSHSAVVAENAMWLFGGMAGLQPKSDLWRYSFLLHQWKKVKALGSPPCLSGHAASVIQHHMVIVGGKCQGRPVSDVWCFSFDTSTWQQVSQLDRLPCLSFHTCVSYCLDPPAGKTPIKCLSYSPPLGSPDSNPKGTVPGACSSSGVNTERNQNSFQSGQDGAEVAKVTGDRGMKAMPDSHLKDCKHTGIDSSSSDTADTRIHVSLTEALIPAAASETANLSFKSFSRKPRYVQLKEEKVEENSSPSFDCPVSMTQSPKSSPGHTVLQASPVCESHTPVADSQKFIPDLIDFSEPSVLKVPPVKLFEELDLLGFQGPDGVLVPSPSSPCYLQQRELRSKDMGDLSNGSVLPVYSQWDPRKSPVQALGCRDWCSPHSPHQQDGPEIELQPLFPQLQPAKLSDVQKSPEERQLVQESLYCKQEPEKPSNKSCQSAPQHWSSSSISVTGQRQGVCPPQNQADAWDTDSSFVESETGEDILLIRTETEVGAENPARPNLGSPWPVESVVSGSASGKKPRNIKDSGMGRRDRGKEQSAYRLKASELRKECVLVLGGHSQELVSGPCRPMPVWKGVLL
ncbi:hypothetical protein ACOMHN_034063 [Nucella lapillus]